MLVTNVVIPPGGRLGRVPWTCLGGLAVVGLTQGKLTGKRVRSSPWRCLLDARLQMGMKKR